jgi:hypothetical protein
VALIPPAWARAFPRTGVRHVPEHELTRTGDSYTDLPKTESGRPSGKRKGQVLRCSRPDPESVSDLLMAHLGEMTELGVGWAPPELGLANPAGEVAAQWPVAK